MLSRSILPTTIFAVLSLLCGCAAGGSNSGITTPQTPTIVWSAPAAVTVGTALSTTQLNATAVVPGTSTAVAGTFTYSPAAGTVLNTVGTQSLSVSFAPADPTHFSAATYSVSLAVNASVAAPAYTWKNVQIVGGGFVSGIIMHPAQQGLMYARTDVGGAYRWSTATSSWVPLLDWLTRAQSNLLGVESIGLDPSDPQRLYLATGTYAESWGSNGAMLLSNDQGATFTTVSLPIKLGSNDDGRNAGERLQVDPNLGTTLYFGSRLDGLWSSTDRGLTWAKVATFPVTGATSGAGVVFETFVKNSASSGSPTSIIYAGVSAKGLGTEPASLYVSTDAGKTWKSVAGAPTGLYVSHGALGPDGNLYLTYGDNIGPSSLSTGKVMQYVLPTLSNPLGTWNDITPPRTSGYQGGYGGLTLDPQLAGAIMVSTLDHYYPVGDDLWRSLDYGKTWYSINTVGAIRDVRLSPWDSFGAASVTNTGNWVASLQIDPFNSAHVVYGNGQTIFTSANMTASDPGLKPSNWSIGALGLEETVITGLASPPAGPAHLLSVMGDLGGFQHIDLTVSPLAGANSNPRFSTGTSIDFAQSAPTSVMRVGYGSNAQLGAYSADSGTTWVPFATNPAGTVNGAGSIAISADGKTLVWAPSDSAAVTSISRDHGVTWQPSSGATGQPQVVSDRINPLTFYLYYSKTGVIMTSIDGGANFTTSQTGLPTNGVLQAAYDAEGDVFLATSSGLYRGSKGSTLVSISGVQSAWAVSEGMPKSGSTTLTIYLGGQIAGQPGLYRSTDNAATWIRIDDAQHEYAYYGIVQGDPRVFGRVYLGTGGRGIPYGDSAN